MQDEHSVVHCRSLREARRNFPTASLLLTHKASPQELRLFASPTHRRSGSCCWGSHDVFAKQRRMTSFLFFFLYFFRTCLLYYPQFFFQSPIPDHETFSIYCFYIVSTTFLVNFLRCTSKIIMCSGYYK